MSAPPRSSYLTRVIALAVALVGLFVIIPVQQALAGSSIVVSLQNDLPKSGIAGYPKVSIAEPAPGQIYCWYTEQLAYNQREGNAVKPGEKRGFYTETQQGGAPCLTAYGENEVDLGIYLKMSPGAEWLSMLPTDRSNSMSLRFEKQPSVCNWNNNLDYCFVLRKSLGTFVVPKHDFPGLLCWTVRSSADNNTLRNQSGTMTITVRSDAVCNTPRGETVLPSRSGDPVYRDYPKPEGTLPAAKSFSPRSAGTSREAQAAPDPPQPNEPGKDEGVIVSFMSSTGVACQMMGILSDEKCKDVAKNELSNFTNLTTDVRKFKVTNSFGDVNERTSICSATHTIPAGAGAGQVTCSKQVVQETSTTTTTTHGWKVGASYKNSFEYKAEVPLNKFSWKHEITVSGEYNGSRSDAVSSRSSVSRQIQISQQALPGMTTKIDVFTQSADANYQYEADLDVGDKGVAQAVYTPAANALGMSPSATQHCLAYVIGGPEANGSLMERQKRMLDSGMSAKDPSLPRASQLLLASAPYYRAGSTGCPGMPSMFPSTAGFKGTGVGTYASTGYGDDGKPLETWVVCVYTMPLSQRASARADAARASRREMQGTDSPCVQQKSNESPAPLPNPGRYIDLNEGAGSNQSEGVTFRGGSRSEQILGTPRADTISLGAGTQQVIRSGRGADVINAASGADQIEAGPGSDHVTVGSADTVYGNQGSDTLTADDARRSVMVGGLGNDVLRATNSTQVLMSGGGGTDTLEVTGSSRGVRLAGGPGSDTYVIGDTTGPAPAIFEMPNQGTDTVETARSITAPLYVDRVVATGDRPVNLTSRDGQQVLVGNDASNVLSPGIGADTADGGDGNDAFLMNWDCPDTVTGGPGADLFVPLGTPATARNGGLAPHAMAHRITDFNPGEGDRIQLRAAVFGTQVMQLSSKWQVVAGTSPRATSAGATILADTGTGLLAFDRDGSGPIIPKVIAMVTNAGDVTPAWLAIS